MAAIHHNRNAGRGQARTKEGKDRLKRVFAKQQKGKPGVRDVKEDANYGTYSSTTKFH